MEVQSNRKASLKCGRGTGCGNSLIIDPREGGLQDMPHRLGRPSIGAVSSLKKNVAVSGARPTAEQQRCARKAQTDHAAGAHRGTVRTARFQREVSL